MANKVIIYDQFGREVDLSSNKNPDRNPLAVAPVLDSFREYVTDGLTPERLAAVFKAADSGDMRSQAELFEQLEEKDGHLLCERDKRKNVLLDLDFIVEPASEDPRDQKIAKFVSETFSNLTDWEDTIVSLQDAVGKGYSGLEIFWDVSSGQAVPTKFDFIEQKRFLYTDEKGLLQKYPRLLTDDDPMGIEVPAWKMLLHKYGGKSGHPTRSGIYRVASWLILFKHYALKDWVIFSEVFGMPLRLGKYSSGASTDDKDALLTAISSLGSDAAGIISDSTAIEFIETVKNASGDLYKMLASFCNGEISKALLGQTLTAEVDGKGSYAASKTHNEVRLDLLRADGRAIAGTVRNQLIRPLVGFNFGWDALIPEYSILFEEPDDLLAKSEWMGNVLDRVAMPRSFVNRSFGIPEQEGEEEMVGGATAPQPSVSTAAKTTVVAKDGAAPQFSDEQQELEDLADMAWTETDLSTNEEKILQIVQEAESYEEAMENLLAFYPEMEMISLQDGLEKALLTADLHGRLMVKDA